MKIDFQVSKTKFEKEVSLLKSQGKMLDKWGVVIRDIDFPVVKAIFIPNIILKLTLPVEIPPGSKLPDGVTLPPNVGPSAKMHFLATNEIPNLSARAFGAKISLADYDQRAPSVIFCDPFNWDEIPYGKLFRGHHIDDKGQSFNVTLGNHPLTKKPFLCMRGIREYHEHPQHSGDDWMQYREHYGLFSTIQTIWKTCIQGAIPNIIIQSPKQVQVNWTPPPRVPK